MTDFTPAVLGFGSKVYVSTDGETYTQVFYTKDVKSPDAELGMVNITNNDSPNMSEEQAPGIFKAGSYELEGVYTSDGFDTLWGYFTNRTLVYVIELFTDGSGYEFQGWVTKPEVETKTENEGNMYKIGFALQTIAQYHTTISMS
ncbi:MAG: hypothetical protein BIFFINMI_03570 [Phycisphaerae bacterium]|nr:hypothetical protein [Phycisphaerae bacterium]